jgi:MFS family permease
VNLNLQDDGVARRILIDLDPLRESRDFRLLFGGQLIGMFGTQLTMVAIPFQVYDLTRSSFQVGAVSLAQLVPLIVGALVGGMVGDAIDRRVILLVTSAALALTSGALAINATLTHPSMVVIYAVSAVAAGFGGIYSTACSSVVPSLVRARQLVAAFATMQVVDQAGMVVGPALSGVLIGAVHLGWVYAVDALTFVLAGSTVALMAAVPPVASGRGSGLGSLRQLFGLIRGRQVLLGAYLIDINAMVFGAPRALFPALAVSVFHGGPRTLGLLYAAPAAGALVGAGTTGWLDRVRHQGRIVIIAVCAWGAAIAAFGLVHALGIALALLGLAGWADVISAVLRTTILQSSVPEALRTRIASVQMAVVEGGPELGAFESGAVATATTTTFSIVSGGVACIAGALLLARLLPEFRRFERGAMPDKAGDGL